ncbi:MAG TPA: MFS transporter, partial [Thermomonospora sp.]|nr:MFS transporter [Thermomonospora sp.]
AVMLAVQLAAALGFYAVMAHVVAHLRDGLGLAAGTIALVLGVRVAVQYALYLPAGPAADLLGAARAGTLACLLRAVGFGALGVVDGRAGLLAAAVLLGMGGALFHPATRSLMAGLHPERRARGFGAVMVAGQIAAVAGPPAGLVLLAPGGLGFLDGGFWLLSGAAAAVWTVAAVLFVPLHRPRRTSRRASAQGLGRSVLAVLRDRAYLRFILLAAPTTLLPTQTMTVVPLKGFEADVRTLYFCVCAAVAAAVQPWCAAGGRAARRWVLQASLASSGAGYLLLIPLNDQGVLSVVALTAVAALHGVSYGLLEPAVFQNVTRYAPPSQVGAYYGVMAFVSGIVAFAGGLVVGRLFDAGPAGVTTALAGLAVVALTAAAGPGLLRAAPRSTVATEAGAPR